MKVAKEFYEIIELKTWRNLPKTEGAYFVMFNSFESIGVRYFNPCNKKDRKEWIKSIARYLIYYEDYEPIPKINLDSLDSTIIKIEAGKDNFFDFINSYLNAYIIELNKRRKERKKDI